MKSAQAAAFWIVLLFAGGGCASPEQLPTYDQTALEWDALHADQGRVVTYGDASAWTILTSDSPYLNLYLDGEEATLDHNRFVLQTFLSGATPMATRIQS